VWKPYLNWKLKHDCHLNADQKREMKRESTWKMYVSRPNILSAKHTHHPKRSMRCFIRSVSKVFCSPKTECVLQFTRLWFRNSLRPSTMHGTKRSIALQKNANPKKESKKTWEERRMSGHFLKKKCPSAHRKATRSLKRERENKLYIIHSWNIKRYDARHKRKTLRLSCIEQMWKWVSFWQLR